MIGEASAITIRPCHGVPEIDACVDIQEKVWGYDERDIIPRRLFIVAQRIGGQVFGAFPTGAAPSETESNTSTSSGMCGFAMALPAVHEKELYLHSHMLAVLPEWRNAGLGRTLKLAQRDEALARGIRKMEWTFDPLEVKNAYLNITRLGAIVRSYTPNFYGPSTSALQAGLQTDRMHAEWFLDSERVADAVAGRRPSASKIVMKVTVPGQLQDWKRSGSGFHRAVEIQAANREIFLRAFENGLAVLAFLKDDQGNGHYQLGKAPTL